MDKLIVETIADTEPFSIGDEIHLIADVDDLARAEKRLQQLLDAADQVEGLERKLSVAESLAHKEILICRKSELELQTAEVKLAAVEKWAKENLPEGWQPSFLVELLAIIGPGGGEADATEV